MFASNTRELTVIQLYYGKSSNEGTVRVLQETSQGRLQRDGLGVCD